MTQTITFSIFSVDLSVFREYEDALFSKNKPQFIFSEVELWQLWDAHAMPGDLLAWLMSAEDAKRFSAASPSGAPFTGLVLGKCTGNHGKSPTKK